MATGYLLGEAAKKMGKVVGFIDKELLTQRREVQREVASFLKRFPSADKPRSRKFMSCLLKNGVASNLEQALLIAVNRRKVRLRSRREELEMASIAKD